MNDIDQELHILLRGRAGESGPPPALPKELLAAPTSTDRRWRSSWLAWAPLTALVTAAVVVPVALVDHDDSSVQLSDVQVQTWISDVCESRPDEPSPDHAAVMGMEVVGAGVCEWKNPRTWQDVAAPIETTAALSVEQSRALMQYLRDAQPGSPDCVLVDSAPDAGYFVMLQDSAGQTWQVTVPKEECLGFTLDDHPYWSPGMVDWLSQTMQSAAES